MILKKLNRLKFLRIYLIGSMDCDFHGGKGWRIEISDWLRSRNAIPINPYNKPLFDYDPLTIEDEKNHHKILKAKENEDYELVTKLTKPIRQADLRICDISDAGIFYWDLDKIVCGSLDEVYLLERQIKPVITVCKQGKKNIPNWFFSVFNHQLFFNTFEEAQNYLDYIDKNSQIDTLGLWKFFNWEPEIERIFGNGG